MWKTCSSGIPISQWFWMKECCRGIWGQRSASSPGPNLVNEFCLSGSESEGPKWDMPGSKCFPSALFMFCSRERWVTASSHSQLPSGGGACLPEWIRRSWELDHWHSVHLREWAVGGLSTVWLRGDGRCASSFEGPGWLKEVTPSNSFPFSRRAREAGFFLSEFHDHTGDRDRRTPLAFVFFPQLGLFYIFSIHEGGVG